MDILKDLILCSETNNKRFLVIGGHAIAGHGYSRNTADLDILISKTDREYWLNIIESKGYKAIQKHEVFARFSTSDSIGLPIDYMFVESEIFEQLFKESISVTLEGQNVRIPSALHLIALKLHALKQRQPHREFKDMLDVAELIKISKINKEVLRQLCNKYDRLDLYEKFLPFCK